MAEIETTQPTPVQNPSGNQEKKERIDELDVIGGLLIKGIRNGFTRIKQLFAPKKVE